MPSFSYSSEGPRPNNQDYVLIKLIPDLGLLLCVADGVGGNNGGEVASSMAITTFLESLEDKRFSMIDAMIAAHKKILETAQQDKLLAGMATTFTAVLIKNNFLSAVHSGDSRAYLLRGNGIKQMSTDHSEVARLLRNGKIEKEDVFDYPRRNVLYSALGSHRELVIDEFSFELYRGDRVVLVTDGFYEAISKKMFRDVSLVSKDIQQFGNELVKLVELEGTSDNYTIAATEIA
jgi:serine/threonine protein phosphatase PrpC